MDTATQELIERVKARDAAAIAAWKKEERERKRRDNARKGTVSA